jgi:hypothetical protein
MFGRFPHSPAIAQISVSSLKLSVSLGEFDSIRNENLHECILFFQKCIFYEK